MEEQKTKIFFLFSIKKSLLDKNKFDFDLNNKILTNLYLTYKIIPENDKDGYQVCLNELKIDENLVHEENQGSLKINLEISDLSNEKKNLKKYEVFIPYTKK